MALLALPPFRKEGKCQSIALPSRPKPAVLLPISPAILPRPEQSKRAVKNKTHPAVQAPPLHGGGVFGGKHHLLFPQFRRRQVLRTAYRDARVSFQLLQVVADRFVENGASAFVPAGCGMKKIRSTFVPHDQSDV